MKLKRNLILLLVGLCVAGMSPRSFASDQGKCPHPEIKKGTILEMAKQSGKFTFLLKALEITGLTEEFQKEGNITVLAPTDDAFRRMSERERNDLLTDKEYLTELLLLHVIDGSVKVKDAIAREKVVSKEGETLFFYKDASGTFVNDAKIIMADIEATNGVVHVIDTVLFPWK
ncbi:MAG: fasciclin domain-containing protein [Pseudomonadota bacterium]